MPPGLHYLPPLNPRSDEFVELFQSFLSSKDERTSILALSEEDAKLFIEIIDRVGVLWNIPRRPLTCFLSGREGIPGCTVGARTSSARIWCPQEVMWEYRVPPRILPIIPQVRPFWAASSFWWICRRSGRCVQTEARCCKVFEGLRTRRQKENPQGRRPSYFSQRRLAHALYSASVKRSPCGRTCPIPTSSA